MSAAPTCQAFSSLPKELISKISESLTQNNVKSLVESSKSTLQAQASIIRQKMIDILTCMAKSNSLRISWFTISPNQMGERPPFFSIRISGDPPVFEYDKFEIEDDLFGGMFGYNTIPISVDSLDKLVDHLIENGPTSQNNAGIITVNEHADHDFIKALKTLSLVKVSNRMPVGGSSKQYIELKDSKKKLLVRLDHENKKYVIVNKTKTLLSAMKGRFKYVVN